jgi:hypothetical protein
MTDIYIIKKALGDELCEYLDWNEMNYDDKISLDLLFNKIVQLLNEKKYEIEELKTEIRNLKSSDEDFPYEQSVGK